jgi:hypothetical protein
LRPRTSTTPSLLSHFCVRRSFSDQVRRPCLFFKQKTKAFAIFHTNHEIPFDSYFVLDIWKDQSLETGVEERSGESVGQRRDFFFLTPNIGGGNTGKESGEIGRGARMTGGILAQERTRVISSRPSTSAFRRCFRFTAPAARPGLCSTLATV